MERDDVPPCPKTLDNQWLPGWHSFGHPNDDGLQSCILCGFTRDTGEVRASPQKETDMAQNNPSPTPMTGNPVITTYTLTAIVSLVIVLVRAYGVQVTQDQENGVLLFLQGQGGVAIIGAFGAAMAWWARRRAYSELSVKVLTGEERPAV